MNFSADMTMTGADMTMTALSHDLGAIGTVHHKYESLETNRTFAVYAPTDWFFKAVQDRPINPIANGYQ